MNVKKILNITEDEWGGTACSNCGKQTISSNSSIITFGNIYSKRQVEAVGPYGESTRELTATYCNPCFDNIMVFIWGERYV